MQLLSRIEATIYDEATQMKIFLQLCTSAATMQCMIFIVPTWQLTVYKMASPSFYSLNDFSVHCNGPILVGKNSQEKKADLGSNQVVCL